MKKMVALLTTVMILAGSVGMAASAETESGTCVHEKIEITAGTREACISATHSVHH